MPIQYPTEHPSVTVRGFVDSEAELLFSLVSDNATYLDSWGETISSRFMNYDRTTGRIAPFIEKGHTVMFHGIWNEQTLVGAIQFAHEPQSRSAWLGYWVAEKYAGHGYATLALKAMTFHAFADLHLCRCEAYSDPRNLASHHVLTRAGYTCVSTRGDQFRYRNGFAPFIVY